MSLTVTTPDVPVTTDSPSVEPILPSLLMLPCMWSDVAALSDTEIPVSLPFVSVTVTDTFVLFPDTEESSESTAMPIWSVTTSSTAFPVGIFSLNVHGMRDCFENAAAFGVLSVFPGMTTDSRSLLSFVRHEYFRRVFCAWLAEKAARDEMPSDFDTLKELAEKVCYYNAKAIINR